MSLLFSTLLVLLLAGFVTQSVRLLAAKRDAESTAWAMSVVTRRLDAVVEQEQHNYESAKQWRAVALELEAEQAGEVAVIPGTDLFGEAAKDGALGKRCQA